MTSRLTEAPSLNETFCRALLRAGLTEEDITTRLGVDPKTVRRWIEGRALPYRRHRWTLAAMLGTAETDLWPQLRSALPRPAEVVALYPHLGTVPRRVWLHLFSSAQNDISLLENSELPIAGDREVMTTLAERARAGVTIWICLGGLEAAKGIGPEAWAATDDVSSAFDRYAPLRGEGQVEIRLYQGAQYNLICRADDQLLVAQYVCGVPATYGPVLHLQQTEGEGMFATYIESFERTWAEAVP